MKFMRMNLSSRIATVILSVFCLSTLIVVVTLEVLHSRSFARIYAGIEGASVELQHQSARDLMREVMLATESSLQRGEYEQFVRFAKQQSHLNEVRSFSFVNSKGEIQLSSQQDSVGQPLSADLWTQIQQAEGTMEIKDAQTLTFYQPLRADADMCRIRRG